MGLIRGILKVGASAVLVATGTASTILKGMSDTVGLEIGSELFGAAKDASFNGIRNMWNVDDQYEEEYEKEEETQRSALKNEIHKMKVQALRCKDMANRTNDEESRQRFMARYDSLMEQANELTEALSQPNEIDID